MYFSNVYLIRVHLRRVTHRHLHTYRRLPHRRAPYTVRYTPVCEIYAAVDARLGGVRLQGLGLSVDVFDIVSNPI